MDINKLSLQNSVCWNNEFHYCIYCQHSNDGFHGKTKDTLICSNKMSMGIQDSKETEMNSSKKSKTNVNVLIIDSHIKITQEWDIKSKYKNAKIHIQYESLPNNYEPSKHKIPSNWNNSYDIILLYQLHIKHELFSILDSVNNYNNKSPRFVIVFDPLANESPQFRSQCFQYHANMVTNNIEASKEIIHQILKIKWIPNRNVKLYKCPFQNCNQGKMTEDGLRDHCPMYHISVANYSQKSIVCPICKTKRYDTPFQVHIRNEHGNVSHREYKKGVCFPIYINTE